jgi:hypothetical protein
MSREDDILRNLEEGQVVDAVLLQGSTKRRTKPNRWGNDILHFALEAAMKRLKRYAKLLNTDAHATNLNESVFRFFVMAEIAKRDRGAKCQTEWSSDGVRYDLLVRTAAGAFVVEFKTYGYNRDYGLDGVPGRWKGHPSPKNEREFRGCLKKLRKLSHPRVTGKYLVLVYQKGEWSDHKHSYERSYADLAPFGAGCVEEIGHCYEKHTACKLITV